MNNPNLKYIFKNLYRLSKNEKEKVYIVGGFIRDIKLKRPTGDIDVAVSSRAMSIAKKYASVIHANFVTLDRENKIYRVLKKTGKKMITVDFSAFRGNSIEEDLRHRDFTINAVACLINNASPDFGVKSLIDPFNGMKDIRNRVIKKVSGRIFTEDPLRMLRAYRLAALLKFRIDNVTEKMISKSAGLIKTVSPERIRDELYKILGVENSCKWICRLSENGLLDKIIPEVLCMKKARDHYYHENGLWEHSIKTLDSLEKIVYNLKSFLPRAHKRALSHLDNDVISGVKRIIILKMCSLFHDIGKPSTLTVDKGRVRFYGHENAGAGMLSEILKRLKTSNNEIRLAEIQVKQHMRPANLCSSENLTDKAVFRYFRDTGESGIDILLLSLADRYSYRSCGNTAGGGFSSLKRQKEFTKTMLNRYYYRRNKVCPPVIINGKELMKMFNLREGPLVGKLLNLIREAQAEGRVKDKNTAKYYIRKYIK